MLHLLVPLLTQAHELVILGQNLVTRTRKVDGNTRYIGTQIVHGKVHLLGQILLVFPNHPAHTGIYQTILVAGSADGKYPFQAEIPNRFRINERVNKTTGSGIHVDANLPTFLGVQLVEGIVNLLHVIVQPSNRHPLNRHHANGVLVASLDNVLRVKRDLLRRHGNHTHFHIPVDSELLPHHLHTGRDNEIRFIDRKTFRFTSLLPALQGCNTPQHTSLGRTHGTRTRAIRFFRRIPQLGKDIHTSTLDLRRLRVLGLVDHVLIHVLGHHFSSVIIHPCSHESRQVQTRITIQHGLVVHDLIGNFARHHTRRHLVFRCHPGLFIRPKNRCDRIFCLHN